MDLSKSIRVRGGYRSTITVWADGLEEFMEGATLEQLRARLDNLQTIRTKILSLNDSILIQMTEDSHIEEECRDSVVKDEILLHMAARLHTRIGEIDRPKRDHKNTETGRNNPHDVVRLPKLNLLKFGGRLTEWLSFWEVFESTVHSSSLDNVKKFHYLKGQLEGEALHLIEGFPVTGTAYDEVVQLLKITYGDYEQLKVAHVMALLDLKEPHFKAEQLSKFRADVECHTRSLDSLGLTRDEMLIIILRRKMPLALLDKVRSFDLVEFKTSLSKEIANMQLTNTKRGTGNQTHPYEEKVGTLNMAVGAKGRRDTRNPKKGQGAQTSCKLCSGNHKWFLCQKYQTNESRISRASQMKLCGSCLGSDHGGRSCTANYLRACRFCGGHHFDKLCPSPSTRKDEAVKTPEGAATFNISTKRDATILPTVQIPLEGIPSAVMCRVLLDQGSQRSFIRQKTLDTLKHTIVGTESLKLQGFTGVSDRRDYNIAKVAFFYHKRREYLNCVVVDTLPDYQSVTSLRKIEHTLRSKGVKLSDPAYGQKEVDILLGADYYYEVVHSGFKRMCGVTLIPTKFGYCLSGRVQAAQSDILVDTVSVLRISETAMERMIGVDTTINDPKQNTEFDLELLWKLDQLGIDSNELDNESKLALTKFEESVVYSPEEQQYSVKLPWKTDNISLPSNYGLALGRLRALRNKLLNDPVTCKAYDEVFKTYVSRGFIEEVDPKGSTQDGRVHYLAHHGVSKASTTTPIRVVFDCSASVGRGPSLNQCLMTSPSLVADLSQQLLRFRVGQYASTSDIEKAFLMVGLQYENSGRV